MRWVSQVVEACEFKQVLSMRDTSVHDKIINNIEHSIRSFIWTVIQYHQIMLHANINLLYRFIAHVPVRTDDDLVFRARAEQVPDGGF